MLVIISDLHFEEEKSRNIAGDGIHPPIKVPRNIHLKAFTKIFCRLAEQARRDKAKKMDLVLAGDIFELHRTALWFEPDAPEVRPYVDADSVDAELETKLLEILDAISDPEETASEVLEALQLLNQKGHYLDENDQIREFPVPVEIHYIPGNHDRLANSTPAVRRTVRELLGFPSSPAPFHHVLTFEQERTLIRHGHEYDRLNFSQDCREKDIIPLHLPEQSYQGASIGDFITVEVVSGLATFFRGRHGDGKILADPLLRQVYQRILEFDDLRPMHAIPNFLLYLPNSDFTPEQIWQQAIKPVAQDLLAAIHKHPFLDAWLEKLDVKGLPDLTDVVQGALSLHFWDWPIWDWNILSLDLAQKLSQSLIRAHKTSAGPELLASREEVILERDYRFVVAGHTHRPAVELIGHRPSVGGQYYVNTGTWRQQLPASPDYRSFGRLKSLSYAVIYGPDEDPGKPALTDKTASLDYWSGVTQRWAK